MVRMKDLPEVMAKHLTDLDLPALEGDPWAGGPALAERRVAIVSTAGLQRREDKVFARGAGDYRVIPKEISSSDLGMSHTSTNFDRSGFQQDVNVVFPIDRLHELETEGVIGSVADFHYSFMGASSPEVMESYARELAALLKKDKVDGVVLAPV